jgi:hypothetical protein
LIYRPKHFRIYDIINFFQETSNLFLIKPSIIKKLAVRKKKNSNVKIESVIIWTSFKLQSFVLRNNRTFTEMKNSQIEGFLKNPSAALQMLKILRMREEEMQQGIEKLQK